MKIQLDWVEDLPIEKQREFFCYLQAMCNRAQAGFAQYGGPKRRRKYWTRIKLEMEKFEKTRNMEQLLNIAVYTWLQSECPEGGPIHFDNTVKSATRFKVRDGIPRPR